VSKPEPLTIEVRIARHDEALFAEVDGEVVALNVANGACFGLNRVASDIWRLIESPAAIADIRDALIARYRVDPADCESQVIALVEALRAEDLVVIAPGGSPAGPAA
jgi:hypothetical protein